MHAKILVVEDEAITALDIQGLLERMGFKVVSVVSNGIGAIQKAKDLKPDLILMDITLKGEMDGIEAADKIMNLFNIPVIYLTGYSDEKTFERIKLTKPYGFISKPISHNELKASIDTALYKYDLDKKLKESEEKYRQWFEDDLTGNFIATHEGKLLECNSAFLEIYGFVNREKAIHSNISKFNFAGWIDLIATLKKEHKIKNYETWHKRPDGKRIYAVANVVGTFNDSNELIQVKGYVLDDTERKKAEENFHKEVKRESFLLELYKSAPQLTDKELYECALDRAVCLTDSNIGFFHIISDDQKTIILNTWNSEALKTCKTSFKTHYPVEQAGNWTYCIQAKGPVVYNDFEHSPNRKGFPEGHVSIKRFISIPVFDEDKAKFIFGVGNKIEEYDDHDVLQIQSVANELYKIITQRHWEQALKEAHNNLEKKVEERTSELKNAYGIVKESETKFRELFNQATEMLSLTELNEDSTIKRYIEVNEAASKRLGYNKDELLNIAPLDLYLDSQSLLNMIAELFEKGYSIAENIQVAKGGRQIPVELYTTLFKLRGKNIVLSISRDIRERNKVETKLKETVTELERS
jgi:PAS domain S-box-containing protein